MKRPHLMWILALALVAGGAGTAGAQEADPESAEVLARQAAYERASEALDSGEYARAVEMYREIATMGDYRADAASYWMAYALAKNGQSRAALRAIREFRAAYSRSEWLDDARYLEAELRAQSGSQMRPEQSDAEEMRMYALNALIRRDPERALPTLEAILRGDSSPQMKQRALFILLQSGEARGVEMAAQIARSSDDRDLRMSALRHLAMMGGDRGTGLLGEIYDSTDDMEIKRTVLEGWAMAGETTRLREIARSTADDELRVSAIRALAFSGDSEGLWQLYDANASREVRAAILEHVFMTGDAARVLEIVRTEQDPELRLAAVRGLAMMGDRGDGDESAAQGEAIIAELKQVYADADGDRDTRMAVLEAMMIRDEIAIMIEMFDMETDPELRTQIVRLLSMSESDEALDFLVRILEQEL